MRGVLNDPRAAETFPQLIRAAAAAYGDDIAITLRGETVPDDSISFAELDRRSAELARGAGRARRRQRQPHRLYPG
jgi:hypothetical protein